MKKFLAVLALCLLAGCSSKGIEVDYVHPNHIDIAKKVLGDPLGKDETQKLLNKTDSVELYYDIIDENQINLSVFNNMDYYYSGDVEVEVCKLKLTVTGLAPYTYASKTVDCPEFVEDTDFIYSGELFNRNDEYAYDVDYEVYYYEDDDTLYDYALDLGTITNDDLKDLANFLYIENILGNYKGEMWVRVYPKAPYDEAYAAQTEEAWNTLDSEHIAGRIWVDAENDMAEIYAGTSSDLIERINFRG